MTELDVETVQFATTLEVQRQRMLRQASITLSSSNALPITEQFDAVPRLSALLSASLEELKVAEEELTQQQDALLESMASNERDLAYYRMLFELSPVATVVTDLNTGIRDANPAMCALIRRDVHNLHRKPLTALVVRDERQSFRAGLARIILTNGATNWLFTIERHTDVPLLVSATVTLIPDRTIGSGSLLWQLQPSLAHASP